MTADCLTQRERVWKWLQRSSAFAAAAFAFLFWFAYPTRTQGVMCRPP